MKYTTLVFSLSAALLPLTQAVALPPALPAVQLTLLGSHSSGIFNGGGSEIVAHDPLTQRLYVVNAQAASLDVLSIRDPAKPRNIATISLLPFGGIANSVAVYGGVVAVAVEAT